MRASRVGRNLKVTDGELRSRNEITLARSTVSSSETIEAVVTASSYIKGAMATVGSTLGFGAKMVGI